MLYIIEPHPDDAFMSLHAHITGPWEDIDKTIVTVTGSEERLKEAESYAKAVGCKWMSLGYRDSEWDKSVAGIKDLTLWRLPWLEEDNQFIFPIGLRHPDHIKIGSMANTMLRAWRYMDAYYVQPDTNQELQAALVGKTVVSVQYAYESKRFFVSRFPSQSLRMLAIQPAYPPRFELVVK